MDPGFDEEEPGPHKSGILLSSIDPKTLAALSHLDLSARVSFRGTKVVGAGAFGDVSKAQCTFPGRATTLVAIKRLRFHSEDDIKSLFEREIHVWAKLTHANVLPLLGYVLDKSGGPLLVSEWMVNGSAWDYALHNDECDLVKLAAGISEGLTYIHQMNIIHSDIKPANIVVSASGEARICDFGSSCMVIEATSRSLANPSAKIQGTPHYLSYELVAAPNQGHTKGSDVWAFGMTIFALLAHQHPYAQSPKEHVSTIIASRKLPTFPSPGASWTSPRLEARDVFRSVCQLCWDHNPSTRADMTLITSILRDPRKHDSIFRTNQLSEEGILHECLHGLLAVLESISKAIDDVSAIHQSLKTVLEGVSATATKILKSSKTDKKVIDLLRNILEAFDFAEAGGTLRRNLRLLEKSIIYILQNVEEIFDLVSEHITSGRLLDTIESERLNELIHSLLEYRKTCNLTLSWHDAMVRDRKSEEINIKLLSELLAPNESYDNDSPTCLENTRVGVRREIIDWVNAKTSPNVLWLHGVAGSGKSTISRTVAEYFDDISQVGAFISFEREKSDPSSVIPTIAFKLAKFDSSIGARIVDQVKKDKDILSAKPALQFSNLLLQPISASSTDAIQEPVVIVLDALDECGVSQKRRDLIQVLRNELPKLPLSFRVLVTSRPETDLVQAFSLYPSNISSIELDCTSSTSQSDVLRYIQIKMHHLVTNGMTVPKDWPWDVNMALLGNAASGLFVWASTAVRLVATSNNPFGTLEGLIRDTRSLNRFGLNELYATVLRGSGISWESQTSKARFSRVLGLVIFGKAPFTIDDMDAFLGFSRLSSSRLILTKFRSLVSFTTSTPVRFFHISFADYLSSPERSTDPWFIDISIERAFHVMQCFTIMRRELQFNICDIPTSFSPNDAIPGLSDRIREKISGRLRYACCFWAQHLHDVPFSAELLKQLTTFAYERLLYWFEVLSLTKSFYDQAVPALRDANEWIWDKEPELSSYLGEAIRLASTFAVPISESTPHIYVTMLPLAEQHSVVSAHYAKLTSSLVTIDRRGAKATTILLKVFEGHTDLVTSVGFSPDGKHVVSGSFDNTIRVWEVESGYVVAGPFEGHTDRVTSVGFSPDGKCVVSGSKDNTVRLWEVESGSVVASPFKGHTEAVTSVGFSPDGKRVVSGSEDNSIRVWVVESDNMVTLPFKGHTDRVTSVGFSPDGKLVVSGSADSTICVWEVEIGRIVAGPFKGHIYTVTSVGFSPDGKYVVSGSQDKTVRVWEVESGNIVAGPFVEHASYVTSVEFSPDGKRVVSASWDKMIRVWGVESGSIVAGPFEGHTSEVTSVRFSPDGKRVVSGSWDTTVRVWEAENGSVDAGLFEGHTDRVTSVGFSLDGQYAVSGSWDTTVIVWEVKNGSIAAGPFKGHSEGVTSVGFSPDGKHVVSGSWDKTICVWDVKSGNIVAGPFKGHTKAVTTVGFSPDGNFIVSGSYDITVRVWEIESGNIVAGPFEGHTFVVNSVGFSPDGKRVVSGSEDDTVRVWEIESGEVVAGPFEGNTEGFTSVGFSPDGKHVVSGSYDYTVRIWEVESNKTCASSFEGHTEGVTSVSFSPDGKHIVSGSYDKTVRVWEVENGNLVAGPFEGHTEGVTSVGFSPDGKRIVSGSWDNTVRIWEVDNGEQLLSSLNIPANTFTSSMSSQERKRVPTSPDGSTRASDMVTAGDFWCSPGEFSNWVMSEDYWIRSKEGKLLLWIPPDIRPTLWRACNVAVFS